MVSTLLLLAGMGGGYFCLGMGTDPGLYASILPQDEMEEEDRQEGRRQEDTLDGSRR